MSRSLFLSAVLTALLHASSFAAQAQPTYSLTPLEPETGPAVEVEPEDINEKGEVVGRLVTSSGSDAFLWRDGVMTILPDLMGGASPLSVATGINNRGDIVGWSFSSEFPGTRGFLIRGGEITDIGAPPGAPDVEPADINNRGEIIGHLPGHGEFLRNRFGEFVILEPPPESGFLSFILAREINERGEIVGTVNTDAGPRAAIWRNGVIEDLGVLEFFEGSIGFAINDGDRVVGQLFFTEGGTAFLWERGELIRLPGSGVTNAFDINNREQVVGGGFGRPSEPERTALLWEKGVVFDLNELISEGDPLEPFVRLVTTHLINNRGQIVADGFDSRDPSRLRTYLLTPAPE